MANATTIAEAAQFSYANVLYMAELNNPADNLRLHAISFLAAYANFDDADENQHPARDWKVPMAEIAYRLPTAYSNPVPGYAADVARIVYASCIAVIQGEAAGRITAAQRVAFLADWNTAWGF